VFGADATPQSVGAGWLRPGAVAVAPDGTLSVADAGRCSGGKTASVHPLSGVGAPISSGGYLAGDLDLLVAVPEPAGFVPLAAAVALARRFVDRGR
jgi:hypothetical protein